MATILIAEDDQMIADIYEKKFSESGFKVVCVDSGSDVLNSIKKEKIDIILLDLMMPKMNGFEVIEKIRKSGYDPNIKIIVFSNLSQKEDREKAMNLGANGFITKAEYKPSELVQEVKRLTGQLDEQKKNEERQKNPNNGDANKKSKSILLIEDEDVFVDMFGEKLRQEGFEVVSAKNGAWGVKEALAGDYDLFIIDMVMPAMTGEEMITKIKMEDKTKNVPIIVLSASVDEKTEKKVKKMGIQEFFVKTQLTPSDLSNKIEEILK